MSQFPLVVGCTPFETPDPRLAAALARAGALAVLDLGRDADAAIAALAALERDPAVRTGFAVRFPDIMAGPVAPAALPARVTTVVVPAGAPVAAFAPRAVFVEVTTADEARSAVAAGAAAVIAKGHEAGGRASDETTFVLIQRLAAARLGVPVYAQGGIGVHTAAAAIAGGAAGVVLDSQLALLAECELPAALRPVIAAMDGSETAIVDGRRVLARPGAPEVPAGQDAAFARPLADRFRTAAGLVRGLEQAIASHLRQASALDPLAPDGRWARAHGVRYPIAQGPMTRVSDRAEFAGAVADAGALPFVALSLLPGREARPLLEETRARCAGKPWGVGILGFAPPELRDEQLALIAEIAPPVALIAGGRPAQARPLEERGIATYLHVPSPGLLDLFLKEGARRFVLEGRECGGHVGPRTSFVLWESAIERLARDPAAGQVSVLFAGGIHDARSAAMVAAAAAPIAARGARVGVLMGTAYLFTREAVESGAILPGFQDEARRCATTVLLDTAPGHSTRCAPTPFVDAFAAERARLAADGVDPQAAWAALEQLNVGRLRIAAKGLERRGGELAAVDEDAQRREGMYMIGQVAALRDDVVTMAALHDEVSAGGSRHLAAVPVPAPAVEAGPHAPRIAPKVAIVGMAAILPGAPDLEAFWANVVLGVDAVDEVPRQRWNADLYFDPKGTGDKTPSKWGGFLPAIPFDPGTYGIPPRSLAAIEPVQLLALEVARRALDDAGAAGRNFDRERASVVFGAEAGTDLSSAYGFRAQFRQFLGELPPELDAALPTLTEDSFPGILANVIAGRIANRLDLGGVNFTVDAACASSLAALDVGCKELATGETDLVVCGGADLHNAITDYLMFASVHALSPTGRCRTFDGKADGIALGEGVVAVVLKRLDDARRDGDRIYAVIDAVAGSSDGRSLGLTAPRKDGQVRALERAYRRAGVSPAELELVEAHGTGTVVGDRTELETLTEIVGGAGARPGQVTLGSVKSNIGHTKCAAGLAGLIKVALAIHRRVLPPTLHVQAPNSFWDAETSPFVFRDRAAPWASPRRRGAVSAFGFGGTNFHAVLSDADEATETPASGLPVWPAELFVLRGATRAAAEAIAARLAAIAGSGAPYALADLARGAALAGDGPVRIAFVATSLAELAERAGRAAAGLARSDGGVFVDDVEPEVAAGAVAMVMPGQGSQRPGMLDELFVAFPRLQAALAPARELCARIFPGAAYTPDAKRAQRAAVTDTRVAQPALGLADLAAARLLEACGVRAAMLAGHSYGELAALAVAGALDERELPAVSAARATSILDAAAGAPGAMAAVKASAAEVERALGADAGVVIANHNAPDQVVIAGADAAIDAAVARLAEARLAAKRIPVACAFHSPIVAGAEAAFARHLAAATVRAPDRPVYGNTDASPYPADPDAIRARLAAQLARPVRWVDEVEAMYAAGARVFVEAGPGAVLTDLVRRTLGARPHLAIAIDAAGPAGAGLAALLAALARLATAGVPVDVAPLFAGRGATAIDLDAPPAVGPAATAWMVDGQRAWPVKGELPPFAMTPVLEPIRLAAAAAPAPTAADPREQVVVEYLRGMRDLVATQKEVMLRFLGSAPAPEASAPVRAAIEAVAVERPAAAEPAPAPAASLPPLELLVAVVSERTGYPAEMLDPDLDLEADLGIDSIKRVEILGTLAERLGLAAGADAASDLVEQLAGVKTLRGMAAFLDRDAASPTSDTGQASPTSDTGRQASPTSDTGQASPTSDTGQVAGPTSDTGRPGPTSDTGQGGEQPQRPPVGRFVVRSERVPDALPNGFRITDRRFLVTDDGAGVAEALAGELRTRGATVEIVAEPPAEPGTLDGVIHLAPLAKAPTLDTRKTLFELARAAEASGAGWLVTATGGAPEHGGVAGLVRTVAREVPNLNSRVIELEPGVPPAEQARLVLGELLADEPRVHVAYRGGERYGFRVTATDGPAGTGELDLGAGHVALITGGARGITARVALALARRGVAVELLGRTPAPAPEPAELAACADDAAIRRHLLAAGPRPPAAIEAELRVIRAARAVRATLAALDAAGAPWRYHAVDVRDAAAVAAVVADVYARHDRLDAVVHGAGVIEDRLLRHKTRESFDRVFDTKVAGARALLAAVRDDLRYLVFFSSVSGVFGNRGQVDYAAANDALDALARHLAARGRTRVLSVAWGPWADTGMISPELEREYARRGVGLIAPDDGVARLLDELGRGDDPHVVLMSATPEALEA